MLCVRSLSGWFVSALALVQCAGTASATDFGIDDEAGYGAFVRAVRGAEYVRSDFLTEARKPRAYGVLAATMAFAERNPLATPPQFQAYVDSLDTALRQHTPGDADLRDLGELFTAVRFSTVDEPPISGLDSDVGERALELLGVRIPEADGSDSIGDRMTAFEVQTARSLRFRAEIVELLVRAFLDQDASGADRPGLGAIVESYLAVEGLDAALDAPAGRADLPQVTSALDAALPDSFAAFAVARDAGFPLLSTMLSGTLDATADATDQVIAEIRGLGPDYGAGLVDSIGVTQNDPAAAAAVLEQLRDDLAALNDERAMSSAIALLMLQNPPPGVGTSAEFERARGVAVFESNAAGNQTRAGLELAGNIGLTVLAAINEDALSTAAGLFSAGLAFDDLFGLSGQDDINMALQTISQQIDELRTEMNARFDRIDAQLNLLYSATLEGLDRLDDIGADVDQIAQDMAATRSSLRRLESRLYGLLEAFLSSVFDTTVDQALNRFDETKLLLEFDSSSTNFVDVASYLQTFATSTARTLGGDFAAPFDIDDADETLGSGANPTGAGEEPFAPLINELSAATTQLGLPALRSSPVPGIEPWTQAASAYAQLMRENPWYFALTYGVQLESFLQGGGAPEIVELRRAGEEITSLLASIRETDASGESALFAALFAEYELAARDLQTQIDLIITGSFTGPEMSQYTNGITTVDFWGDDTQNVGALAPTLDGIRFSFPFLGKQTLAFASAPDTGYRTFAPAGSSGDADVRSLQLYALLQRARTGSGFRVWGEPEILLGIFGRAAAWLGSEDDRAGALVTRDVDFQGIAGNGNPILFTDVFSVGGAIFGAWQESPIDSVYPLSRDSLLTGSLWCYENPVPILGCISLARILDDATVFDRTAVRAETQRNFAEIRADVFATNALLALTDDGSDGGVPSALAAAAARLDDIETLIDAYVSLGVPDALTGSDAVRSALRAAPGVGELGLRSGDVVALIDTIRRVDDDLVNGWTDPTVNLTNIDGVLMTRLGVVADEISRALANDAVAPAYLRWSIAELDALADRAFQTASPDSFVAESGRTLTVQTQFETDPTRGFDIPVTGLLANDAESDRRELNVDQAFGPGDDGYVAPQHGAVMIAADGSVVYTPDAGFVGDDTFTYRAQTTFNGLTVTSAPTTVFIRVEPAACIADLVPPFGIVDLDDVDAFIAVFLNGDAAADFVPPFGVVDLADVDAFITAFLGGCS